MKGLRHDIPLLTTASQATQRFTGKRFLELRLPLEVLANGGSHFGGAN
jgi:hypothetical protein